MKTVQIGALPSDDVAALISSALQEISVAMIHSLNASAFAVFTHEQISALKPASFAALTPNAIKAITPARIYPNVNHIANPNFI